MTNEIYHHGIIGMKWGVRRYQPYPKGYMGMSCLHGLDYSYEDKSDKFKKMVECLTYPEYAFTDWN